MKKIILVIFIVLVFGISNAHANRYEFCEGFNEGYKSIKGNMSIVPICPIAPITPINSTAFREGIKAGMQAARKR